jgi:hypothetical protein
VRLTKLCPFTVDQISITQLTIRFELWSLNMSDGTLPPAPPPPPVYPSPLPPQAGAKGVRKSHLGLILAGAVVVFLIFRMMSGSSSSSSTGAPAASSDNPIIGSWTLLDTDKDYCGTHEEFKTDSMSEVKAGATTTYSAIYLIKPGYVDVAENGDLSHYGQWDETGPDEITFRINSLYVVASCKYHRD